MGVTFLPPEAINPHQEPSQGTEKSPLSSDFTLPLIWYWDMQCPEAEICSCQLRAHLPSRLFSCRDSHPQGELPHFSEQGCSRQTAAGTDTTNLWPGVSRQGRIVMAKCSQGKNSKSEFSIRAVKSCLEYQNPNKQTKKNAGAKSGSKSESRFTKPFCNSW